MAVPSMGFRSDKLKGISDPKKCGSREFFSGMAQYEHDTCLSAIQNLNVPANKLLYHN